MKTLDQHNTQRRKDLGLYKNPKPKKNGIECPHCRKELYDTDPSMTLASIPPQKRVHCKKCGYSGHRVA